MYDTTIRASVVDCAALALWLTSIILFGKFAASMGSEVSLAVGAVIASIGGAAMWVASVIHRVEARISDKIVVELRATAGTQPTILSSVR